MKNMMLAVGLCALGLHAVVGHSLEVSPPVAISDQVDLVRLDGLFTEGDDAKIEREFRRAKDSSRKFVLSITSGGGDVDLATFHTWKKLASVADRYQAKFGRPLVVVFLETCASECTVFAAALNRFSNPDHLKIRTLSSTEFLFHGPVPRLGAGVGQVVPFASATEQETETANLFSAYLGAGVDANWLMRNRQMFSTQMPTTIPAGHLCSADVGLLAHDSCLDGDDSDLLNDAAKLAEMPVANEPTQHSLYDLFFKIEKVWPTF